MLTTPQVDLSKPWFDSDEHAEALCKHYSVVTVEDVALYYIYSYRLREFDKSLVKPTLFGFFRAWRRNRQILKRFGLSRKKWLEHKAFVEASLEEDTPLTNLPKGRSFDTTLANFLADLQIFFGRNTNETFESVLKLPYASVREYKIAVAKYRAQERKERMADTNGSSESFEELDHHIKRKSPYSRAIRAEKAARDRANL